MRCQSRALISSVLLIGLLQIAAGQEAPSDVDPAVLQQWIAALNSQDAVTRASALIEMGAAGPAAAAAVPALRACLTHEDNLVRGLAAEALGAIGPQAAVAADEIARLIGDPDPVVRLSAVGALGQIGSASPAAVNALQQAATDPFDEVRAAATESLQRLNLRSTTGGAAAEPPPPATRETPAAATGAPEAIAPSAPYWTDPSGAPMTTGDQPAVRQPVGPAEQPGPAGGRQFPEVRQAPPIEGADTPIRPPAIRRAGGSGDAPAPPPVPTHDGRSLYEWIQLLDAPELDTRIGAANALGAMGEDAVPAIGPLNRARLHDAHESTQRQAALALCKIMGVALGEVLPRPPGAGTGGGEGSGEGGPVPQGQVFYLYAIHDVSDDGVIVDPDLSRTSDDFSSYLFGFCNENLNYLDVAEAYKYRMDAKARGLDTTQRLFDLIKSDPDAEEVLKNYKLFHGYKNDYIARITCNQQTLYCYWRRLEEGGFEWTVGADHLGMSPGKYTAEITIWTKDGFRLDFDVPFTQVVELDEDLDEFSSTAGPHQLAVEERQNLANAPNNEARARALQYVVKEMVGDIHSVMVARPMMPVDATPYLQDALSMIEQSLGLAPPAEGNTFPMELLSGLITACAEYPTEQSIGIMRTATAMIEGMMSSPAITVNERSRGIGHYYRMHAFSTLGKMLLKYNMDIAAFHRYQALAHQSENMVIAPWDPSGTVKPNLIAGLLPKWPQAGWWSAHNDELQPPEMAELPADGGDGDGTGDGDGSGEGAGTSFVKEKLDELVAEFDREEAWLHTCMGGGFQIALSRTDEAWSKLQALRVQAEAKIARIASLYRTLQPIESTRSDDYLEDYFQAELRRNPDARLEELIPGGNWPTFVGERVFRTLKEMFIEAGEPPPENEERAARAIVEMIGIEHKRLGEIRQQQRAIIDNAVEAYSNISEELTLKQDDVRWVKKQIPENQALVQSRLRLAKVQMYCAAGMREEFTAAARDLVDDGEHLAMVSFLEGVDALQRGKPSLALNALRQALELRELDSMADVLAEEEAAEAGAAPRAPSEPKVDPVTASITSMIQQLELQYVQVIRDKTHYDSEMVRDRCRYELEKHGDPGFIGYVKDILSSGVYTSVSAIGDKLGQYSSLTDAFANCLTEATDADKVQRLGGLHETLAERQGVILDEARLQIIGLTLIERLRNAGLSFQQINELTTRGFIDAANEHFKLKGDAATAAPEAGWELEEDDAKRMLATIKLALRNEDMARLLKHSREPLTAETGGSYYNLEEFDTSFRVNVPILDVDVDISDTVNVWNVFVFLGPNALVNSKGSGFMDFAHPTVSSSANGVMTLKEAIATRVGLPKLARMLGEMEGGGELMRDFITFYEKSSFVGRWTADAMIGWYARTGAEVLARVTAMRAGLGQEDQEWWARVVAEIASALNTYGAGDIDVAYRMARHGAKASVVKSLAEAQTALGRSTADAEQTAQLLSEYTGRLEQILARMDAGELGPADIAGLRSQMTQLRDEILSIRSRVNAGEAGAELRVRQEALEQAYSSMEAASFGQKEMSGRCAQAVREAREAVLDRVGRMREDTASIEGVIGRVRSAPDDTGARVLQPGEPGATGEVISATSGRQLDYSGRIFKDADDLMMQGQFGRAAGAYEEWLDLMAHRKMQGTDLWDDVSRKLREAQLADQAQQRWLTAGSAATEMPQFEREFGPDELERLMRDPDIVLVPVGQGARDPLFVCERIRVGQLRNGQLVGEAWTAQPVAVFKPDSGRFGATSGQAEDFFSWLSGKAGLRAPATTRGELQFQGRLARTGNDWVALDGPAKKGTFVRFAPGTDWRQIIEMDPSMAHVLKKAYGEDIAFSAWCGDWDRHALNHRITADGHVLHMDRNNGQLWEELSTPLSPGTPATDAQIAEMKRIMLTRMRMMWTAASGGQSLYQPTAWMERYLSLEDFGPTLRKIDEITPDMMRQRLNQMPELTDLQKDQIVAQLQLRRRLLPEVLDEFVTWTRVRPDGLAPTDWIERAPRLRVRPMPIAPAPEPLEASVALPAAA